MKRKMNIRNTINNQKRRYIFLIGLALLAFITGILFIFILGNDNKELINSSITNFYNSDKNLWNEFFSSLFNNYIYILIIWILGVSIIGIPIIIVMYIFKMFLFGFSISSIIETFKFKGILINLIDVFPNKITFSIVLILITSYSLSFSYKLFKALFFKVAINFREMMNKYVKILLFSLVILLICSIYEGFISNYLLNFFNI